MAISDDELKQLAKKAGLGSRSTKKLVDANNTDKSPTSSSPRGHGAPSQPSVSYGDDF